MKRAGIILCLWGLLPPFCGILHAQSYHIYRPVPRAVKERSSDEHFPRIEPMISGVLSGSGMEDGDGESPVPVLYGGRAGIYTVLSPYITLGAEGVSLKGEGHPGGFPVNIQRKGAALVYRGNLDSFGEPAFYWLAEVGLMHTRASVKKVRMGDVSWRSVWWAVGAGVKWEFFDPCFLSLEYRLNYEPSPSSSYILRGSRWRHDFSAGFSWKF